ncbi:hypothetical protein CJ030_MR4G023636 [Morella rubra]|uniref:RNase H type-1 domain-containing protein n=1 Tax=Morella rubra TaxID=262757 RepID=A0A6A1VSQ2_9ROSI|nr:hypothetical protein CJ030_MR4G023636 [Morella rubra]
MGDIWRRFAEHSYAWVEVERSGIHCWQPPQLRRLKLNTNVVIRLFGSYIAVSFKDSFSSLCMAYTERFGAIDPLVGEAVALAEATLLAKWHRWNRVVFESDSFVLCDAVSSSAQPQLWAISALISHIRCCLDEFADRRITWVPCRCNAMAHLLAG